MSEDVLEQLESLRGVRARVEPPQAFLAAVKGRRIRRRIVRTTEFVALIGVAVVAAFMIPKTPTTVAPGPGDAAGAPIVRDAAFLPETSSAQLIRENRDLPPERMVLGTSGGSAPSRPIGVRSISAATSGL